MRIVGIVEEMEGEVRKMLGEEVLNHLMTVACHNDKLTDTRGSHCIYGPLQEGTATHRKKAFRLRVRQWTQTFSHSCGQNHSYHPNTFKMVSTTVCVCSLRPKVMRRHDSSPLSVMNLIL